MSAVVTTTNERQLPEPVARRGIQEAQWLTLKNSLFPGASGDSVLMVWDYCKARGLDPMKKPCHIVPMSVKDAKTGDYVWRDVVMPGIYEYRTTAARTGQYLGHSKPVYGPTIEYLGVAAPEWCEMTVYRWNTTAQMRCEFTVQLYLREYAGTRKDKKTGELILNDRWGKAPIQMLTKCTEAAALREAFPEDLGGTHTADEADTWLEPLVVDVTPGKRVNPRPDLSLVDDDELLSVYSSAVNLLNQDKDDPYIGISLVDFEEKYLRGKDDLYTALLDKLAKDGIMTKTGWRNLIKAGKEQAEKDAAL